uniref:Uncharacterized protein n=1 Tax=Glossina austeni TaxID=7395 RepID=A0A1A9UH67_GLOAU
MLRDLDLKIFINRRDVMFDAKNGKRKTIANLLLCVKLSRDCRSHNESKQLSYLHLNDKRSFTDQVKVIFTPRERMERIERKLKRSHTGRRLSFHFSKSKKDFYANKTNPREYAVEMHMKSHKRYYYNDLKLIDSAPRDINMNYNK